MKKKVLVLGSTGMIGHQVYHHLNLSDDYCLSNISYRKKLNEDSIVIDATDEKSFFKKIRNLKPDYIINCIGVLMSVSDQDPEKAIQINALLPHKLVRLADEIDAKLIHMSTDCVFSGRKKQPYIETDPKDGLDAYAKTKGLGEIISDRHLTLRTSVVGPELKDDGEELFHWFMSQSGEIQGYTDTIWSGVTTLELSKAVKWAIENDVNGLYHITNGTPISKNELLHLFQKYTQKEICINPVEGKQAT